jgi:hemin uptake protein HemP
MQPLQRHVVCTGRVPDTQADCGDAAIRRLSGEEIFGGARKVTIEHNQRIYTLRITAQGKLILTA